MPKDRWAWLFEQVIPSERGAGHSIIEQVLSRLEQHQWTAHDVFGVRLALEEAIVNAIKHGNRLDESKRVHVVCKMSSHKLRIEIADEGDGFQPGEVPDPTAPDNLDTPNGRGIMLMRSFMTRVEYSPSGNRVVMEKERAKAS